jgi:hypothetical protein
MNEMMVLKNAAGVPVLRWLTLMTTPNAMRFHGKTKT